MTEHTAAEIVAILEAEARRLRDLEHEARMLLHERNDPVGYRGLMREKARLLMELPATVGRLPVGPGGFEASLARRHDAQIESFSHRAGQAVALGSVFYMSALLYPDDYQEGEKNDLDKFIDSVRESAASRG
jgi:hypothetical protein